METMDASRLNARVELIKVLKPLDAGNYQFIGKLLKINDPSFGNSKKEVMMKGHLPSLDLGRWFEVTGEWNLSSTNQKMFYIHTIQASAPISIYFEIKRIMTYKKETGWAKIEVNLKEYGARYIPTSKIYVIGLFPSLYEGDEFSGIGYWDRHVIYGYSFKLSEPPCRQFPQLTKGIVKILKRIKGIGKKQANAIAEQFGADTFSAIESDWRVLLTIPRMTEQKAQEIQNEILRYREFSNLSIYLLSAGIDPRKTVTIYDALGLESVSIVRKDPYLLCSLPHVDFLDADSIAYREGISFHDQKRIEEGILYYLLTDSQMNGNLYMDRGQLEQNLFQFLWKKTPFQRETSLLPLGKDEIREAMNELVKNERILVEEFEPGHHCVYLTAHYALEMKIVHHLVALLKGNLGFTVTSSEVDHALEQYVMETGMTLAVKQQEAVHMALQNPISILTGGPGTGKTQTINAVIQVIQLIHPNAQIHLCAPTGRAAKRMTELTGMTATTIHRAIHLTDVRFDQNVERLYGDFLIVDESSMIDAYLFSKLLEAVNVDMKILFVGDVDQLPSIGAGLILRDLIDSKKIPTTTLTEIFRQAKDSQIVTNAHKVIQGKIVGESDGLTFDEKLGDFYFVQKEDTERIKNLIIGFIKRLMESPHNFKLQDIQVLTPMKEGELGTNALNRIIQETFNPHIDKELEMELFQTSKSGVINERFDVFRVGDRVIHTINDYDLKVFNGEIGTIHKIYNDESGNLMMKVNYDDGMVTYDEALAKEELMLAYAMTVHKSQGCEFTVVIMPIHPSQQSMLERHLLYTAFTRAKGKVVLAGTYEALNKGILNNITYHRNSKIKDRLILELS